MERPRLTDRRQARLWPGWRHFGFLTDLDGDAPSVDAFHRARCHRRARHPRPQGGRRARDLGPLLRQQRLAAVRSAGPQPHPLDATIGQPAPVDGRTVAATMRNRLIDIPGRLVNRAGTLTLRGPAHWPWAQWFHRRLACLRALPPVPI